MLLDAAVVADPSHRCSVAIRTDVHCQGAHTVGRLCLTIDRPFHVAFVGGLCLDNNHQVVDTGCFDVPNATSAVLSLYTSLYNKSLSSGQQSLTSQCTAVTW